jgi:hypothetical protein
MAASVASHFQYAEGSQLYRPPLTSQLYTPIPVNVDLPDLLEGDNTAIGTAVRAKVEEARIEASKHARPNDDGSDSDDGSDEDGRRVRSRTTKAAQDGYGPAGAMRQGNYLSSLNPSAKDIGVRPFFGEPNRDVYSDPQSTFGYENRDLPMAYTGESLNSKLWILNEIFEEDLWPVKVVAPWQKHDSTAPIVLDRFIFDSAQLTRTPYRAPSRLITTRQDSKRAGIVRYGVMHELSYEFYKTEQGRMIWAGNQEQIKFAILEMACLAVIVELMGCWRPHENLTSASGMPHTMANFRAVLIDELDAWDRIHCYQDGLFTLAHALKKRINRRVRVPESNLVLILPEGASKYAKGSANPPNIAASSSSSSTSAPRASLDPSTSRIQVNGVGRTYESRKFRVGAGSEDDWYDPMFRERQYGIHYQVAGETEDCKNAGSIANFRTNHLDFKVYRCETDDWAWHSFRDVFKFNQLYDTTGDITVLGRCILSDSKVWISRSTDSDDEVKQKSQAKHNLYRQGRSLATPTLQILLGPEKFNLMKEAFKKRSDQTLHSNFRRECEAKFRNVLANYNPAECPGLVEWDDTKTQYFLEHVNIERKDFWELCMDYNIPTFISHRVYVPWIRWMSGSAIMCAGGGESARTYVGNASYRRAFDAALGNYRAAFNLGMRALVTDDRKVEIDHTAYIGEYVGGDNGKFWYTPDHKEHLKKHRINVNEASMFAFAIPPLSEKESAPYQDITGEFNRRLVDDNGRPHCDSAFFYSQWWGISANHVAIAQMPVIQKAINSAGLSTITCQGLQYTWDCNKRDYVRVIRNQGPWGQFLDAGFQKLRRQQAAALPVCRALSNPNIVVV